MKRYLVDITSNRQKFSIKIMIEEISISSCKQYILDLQTKIDIQVKMLKITIGKDTYAYYYRDFNTLRIRKNHILIYEEYNGVICEDLQILSNHCL